MHQLASRFLKSKRLKHAVTKGEEREVPIQEFFAEHLPSTFSGARGEVVDSRDEHSPQLDLMIYDSIRNFAFYSGNSALLPAEALLVSVEVKSLLTRDEIRRSILAAQRLKALRPFGLPTAPPRTKGKAADKRCRFFHCIIAYKTDLELDKWLYQEFNRYLEEATKLQAPIWSIDRIYVPNHGLVNPVHSIGRPEGNNSGDALLHLFMHTLNFLQRENGRRDPTPYDLYSGRLLRGWTKLT